MKSIMQDNDGTCYLCIKMNRDYSRKITEEHHCIFGTGNRKLSEKYGLKVRLCIMHHREGKEAVHQNGTNARILQKDAQRAFEEHYPNLPFREIFGINYLTEEDRKEEKPHESKMEEGFWLIEEGEECL